MVVAANPVGNLTRLVAGFQVSKFGRVEGEPRLTVALALSAQMREM